MILGSLMLFWATKSVLYALAAGKCITETGVNFNREYISVVLNPYISPEDGFNYKAKKEQDLLPMLETIHKRFDKIMIITETQTGYIEDYIPLAVAKYNHMLNTSYNTTRQQLQVSLNLPMGRIESDREHLTHHLQNLHAQATVSNEIFRATVSGIVIDYTSHQGKVDDSVIAEDLGKARQVFSEIKSSSMQIAVALPIVTRFTLPRHNKFYSIIPAAVSQADQVMFTIYPSDQYMEQVSNGRHVDYFIGIFEDIIAMNLSVPVSFKTAWPDTNDNGFRSYSNQIDFWKGIGQWAEERNTSVVFEGAFDTPYSSYAYLKTFGWWRLVPSGSNKNSSEYIFEEKITLAGCAREILNPRRNQSLLRPQLNIHFSKEWFGVNFEFMKTTTSSNQVDIKDLLLDQISLVLDRFGKVFINLLANHQVNRKLESVPKSIATLNSNLGGIGRNTSATEVIIYFSGDDISQAIWGLETALEFAKEANDIFPDTVTSFILGGNYDEQDSEIFNYVNSKKGNYTFGRFFGMNVCFSSQFDTPGEGNTIIHKLSSAGVTLLLFGYAAPNKWIMLGLESALALITASFESCRLRIQSVAPEMRVAFYTSWSDEDENKFVNYAQTVNFWEEMNAWAVKTNTTVILDGAFEDGDHDTCGWWMLPPAEAPSTKKHTNFPLQEKKTIARRLLGEDISSGNESQLEKPFPGLSELVSASNHTNQHSKEKKMNAPSQLGGGMSSVSKHPAPGLGVGEIIGIVAGTVVFVSGLFLGYNCYLRRWKRRYALLDLEIDEFFNGSAGENSEFDKSAYDKNSWEIDKPCFTIDMQRILGSGEFGVVCEGSVRPHDNLSETTSSDADMVVAVKMCRPGCNTALKGLLSEIKILTYLGKHENVVSLVGAHTDLISLGKVYVFVEFCELGSLLNFLRKIRLEVESDPENLSYHQDDLHRWTREIAGGMEFLVEKRIVHADLATRNVLLNSDKIAKISDFGLSRRLYNYSQYVKKQQEPLPWRWMSPESLRLMEFNEKTDVWAFGVTLWEIYTLGDVPYPGLSWEMDFASRLENGLVLDKPRYCNLFEYSIMLKCWAINHALRPTFAQLSHEVNLQIYVNQI